jgi:hypothetical protein
MKNNLPVSHTWRNSPFDEEGEEDFQILWFSEYGAILLRNFSCLTCSISRPTPK